LRHRKTATVALDFINQGKSYPKLLFAADPGALVSPVQAENLARELYDCRLVKLGSGVAQRRCELRYPEGPKSCGICAVI